ncbi:bifunctional diguanylate cyclase/phosphodiesterase [Actinoplanes bogorensis]|uniref:Bifunctional diguanylate cyclase/phosphodiesterase n=1 Tax=Paractinoplanes bogorensis TaxID=1610840 RepID=A0ABS5Z5J1_9ACTN|nr:bifunctional diguanylate cyclase/phosphodiesterase [Actinoplanes bogorensis]MBU2670204.1 bifunctional diguanylate cyclase/phosphodiesterase [Actinoplanes bogorensis]
MSRLDQARAPGLAPVLIAVLALAGAATWLFVRDPDDLALGNLGGSVVLLAAALSCYRAAGRNAPAGPKRGFWRLWSGSAAVLFLSTVAATVSAADDGVSMPLYEAVPTLLSLNVAMLAFRHLPLHPRSRVDWMRLVLDGAAVAVCGSVFFSYILLNGQGAGVSVGTRVAAAVVGVGCLLALVVFGRAAVNPEGPVDTGALAILALTPVIGLAAVLVFLQGTALGMLLLSVLGYPLVGLTMCAAAYRQSLADSGAVRRGRRGRASLADPLQHVAVSVVATLVILVSAREMEARGRAVIIGAVLIATILVVRQLLTVREHAAALSTIRRQQADLQELALSDALTGLPSRTAFAVALTERLDAASPATALIIDIDDFKKINDTLGPAAADQLLCQVAQRLRQTSDPAELVARLGGDEFAVLLPSTDPAVTEQAAIRAQAALGEPVQSGELQLMLHGSVGIASAGPGDSADEVLRNGDIAMYAAKDSGKATWVRYEPRMRQDMTEHARIAGELRHAIDHGQLRLVHQPIFDLHTGRIHGAEALARWQHPDRGLVSPACFIPIAERSGLIVPIGAWVLREACTTLARWRREHPGTAIQAINVNVAVRQLREAGFADLVADTLEQTGLGPENLILEITESAVVDGPHVQEALVRLHRMGIRLALDDFGTGQSSLSLLRAFPVDIIKLDKSFVDGTDRGRHAIAAAVSQLAGNLGLKAVAEGIEAEDQLDRLREMNFHYGQGYLLARPMSADECGALMAKPAQALSA